MLLTGLLALATAVMRLFPETRAARWLHLRMVELPLAWLSKLQRKHILFLIVAVGAAQPLMMLGAADLALVIAWDMTLYVDAALAVYAAAALARARAAWHQVRKRTPYWLKRPFTRARPRAASTPRRRPERPANASNDDEGPAPPLRIAA